MKIKFGAIVTDGRNKIGGQVASKNKAGNYLKTKSTPTNPNTSFQAGVRNLFGSLAQSWRGLTQAQRDSWISGAPNFPYTDIFGDTKILSGFSLYMQLNSNLNAVGVTLLTTCPSPGTTPAATLSAVLYDVGVTLTPNALPTTVPAGCSAIISGTPVLGDGRAFSKSKIRQLKVLAAAANINVTFYSTYFDRFGSPSETANVFFGLHFVNTATGQVSPMSIVKMASA